MRVTDHIRLLKKPEKSDLKTFVRIEKIVHKWISTEAIATRYTEEILQLFHDAFGVQPVTFIKDLFFPNQLTLRATYARQDFILSAFKKAKRTIKLETRQIALENVYRSIVADLFDPYVSLLVASIQLKEGAFKSFELANLEHGEFNKYEFLKKRLGSDDLLKGYFSIIRNAISHAGSHGISRDGDHILFRNIKRSGQPSVSDTKIVTTAQLIDYIQDLIDFIVAIETAVNIMGLDMKDTIVQTSEAARAFQPLITQKQLAVRRNKNDRTYDKVWNSNKLSEEERRDYFIRLFAQGCQKNDMPARTIQFKDTFVIIQIPRKPLRGTEGQYLINRMAELINYLLLAEMFFHFKYSDYLVEEIKEPGEQSLQLWLKADELKAFNIGEASIHDLMHDGKLFRDTQHQRVVVDFDKLDETENLSLKFGRKRKKR
ncbi:hypothetical protein [Mucilaginibacter sp.]|uniref:hypothetical protein n=1 Tax=Mucilaginibacter sp. TaxID=1882438 RepID=UPI002639F5F9|nr:hypothetical protein [Mucilaginibacter sp.]MDB4918721.1 hypothetical protein [Mucilaginibacter sp.]